MCNKIKLTGCIIMGIFLLLPVSSFAQDSSKKAQYQKTPATKGYRYNLKRVLGDIEENFKKADEKIEQAGIKKRNEEREAKIIEHFERGNTFYKEGKLKEAKKEWQKALVVSKDPEMKDYIRKSVKRANAEEAARKKEEREREKRLEAEQNEKERKELEGKRRFEAEKREQKHKQKEDQGKLERQKREEEVIRKKEEQKRKKEEARLENKRQRERLKVKRKRQKEQKNRQKEQERLEKERIEKSKKVIIQDVKEGVLDVEGKSKIKLEDLNYKTEKECLDVLEKKPEDKEAFDNLVKLYRLQSKYIERGKEFYNKGDYQAAIEEFKKALAIEPGNKKVIRWMKKAEDKFSR